MLQGWVKNPNLPVGKVTVAAVSENAIAVVIALQRLGIQVLKIHSSEHFAVPVASHADMRCCLTGAGIGFCTDVQMQNEFKGIGAHLIRTNVQDFSTYPEDCSLNAARVGQIVFANPKCICMELKIDIKQKHLKLIPVHQGYAKCSIAVISEQAIMTADSGIAHVAKSAGLNVLLLQPGHIVLDGYSYGFIGGACGKLAADVMAFAGSLTTHPQAAEILAFLEKQNVQALSLCKGPLQDVGGILPLTENTDAGQ